MGIRPDALFSNLCVDLSMHVGKDYVDFCLQNPNLPLHPDATLSQAFCSSLLKSFYKKFVDKTNKDADLKALEMFTSVNNRCKDWRLSLNSTRDEELFNLLKQEIDRFLHPGGETLVSSYYDLLDRGRCGPGVALGATGDDFYTKLFSSVLSTTSTQLYDLYSSYLSWFPDWVDAELTRLFHFKSHEVCLKSRLCFVPKSTTISRTICVEPSLNMFFQLGLGGIVEDRLKSYFGISLDTQPFINREMARIGSIDGSIGTIDLSSASDSMSLRMLESVLPSWFFDLLLSLRTPATQCNGSSYPLFMVSTMGNGFTFPLQTMLFGCVVSACNRFRSSTSRCNGGVPGSWGVFGDDICCHREVYSDVVRLLTLLGFQVNEQKSFVEGPFRESCGSDWFSGHNIRGVYIRTLRGMQSRYVAINRLTEWCERSGFYLTRTLTYLRTHVRGLYVPLYENDDSGIKVPLSVLPIKRWDKAKTQSLLYVCYVSRPRVIRIKDSSFHLPPGERGRLFNLYGLYQSFLNGSIVTDTIGLRHRVNRYSTKLRVAPCWDYTKDPSPVAGESWKRGWNPAVYQCLTDTSQR
jgi:hypothetical protein